MIASDKLVEVISGNLNSVDYSTGNIWVDFGKRSDVFNIEEFGSSDELVELLAKLSLTHYIYDIHRFDNAWQTDIDIFIEPSNNIQTNINADVIDATLDFYTKAKEP